MINTTEMIQCPWCINKTSLGEWDANTFKQCVTREMRRSYINLTKNRAFERRSDTFYLCPICGKWSRGCQLKIVDTDNEELKKLGGEPIILTRKTKN